MDEGARRALLQRINALERQQVKYRQGVVTDDSPLSVALGGSEIPYTNVKRVAGGTLAIGDVVAVLTFGNDLIVLGKVV